MAVPTISSVTPAAGLTKGGNLVVIEGTNFRLPPTPPPGNTSGEPAQVTVSVKFGNEESAWAHAITTEKIHAIVPPWPGPWSIALPESLDVRVANLDDDGLEIAGENVTSLDAYSVDRPSLQEETDWLRVNKELIAHLRPHLLTEVWLGAQGDFDDTPSDGLNEPKEARLPKLILQGPDTNEDRLYALERMEAEEDSVLGPDYYTRRKPPRTVMAVYDVTGFADTSRALFALGQAFSLLFRDHQWLKVPRDPSDPSRGTADYEIEIPFDGQPTYETAPELDNLRTFSAVVSIRGVDIDETEGLVIERGRTVDEVITSIQEIE